MARVNITVPDDLLHRARSEQLNVSRLAASALAEELDRRAKIAALDGYLRDLAAEIGAISSEEQEAARQWADRVLGEQGQPASRRATRSA